METTLIQNKMKQKKGRKKEEKNNNGLSYYVNPFIS